MLTTVVGNYPKIPGRPRPARLRAAIARFQRGEIAEDELHRIEDEVTVEVIQEQAEAGIDIISDGQIRWEDDQTFSRFLDSFVGEVEAFYANDSLDYAGKVAGRDEIFSRYSRIFADDVQPTFQVSTFQYFLDIPLNNAIILARMRYHHRLTDFQTLLEEKGSLREAVRYLAAEADSADDPFELLPSTAVATTAQQASGARDR